MLEDYMTEQESVDEFFRNAEEVMSELEEDYEDCLDDTEHKGFFGEEYGIYFDAMDNLKGAFETETGLEVVHLMKPSGLIVEEMIESLLDHDEDFDNLKGFDVEIDRSRKQALMRELVKRDIEQSAIKCGSLDFD